MKSLASGMLLLSCATAMAEDLPVPPIPPERPQITERAPVPNIDAHGPVAPPSNEPSVDVRLYKAHLPDPSMGFAPGSRYQPVEDRKVALQPPGLSLTVPLK
jgi:hypothetical protein